MADVEHSLTDIVNDGLVALAMALGNELGLFDVLCNHFIEPATILEIASEADLKPRYVKEWLGGMVAASIVNVVKFDDVTKYVIPVEHRSKVVVAAKKASAIPLLAARQQHVKKCFHRNGPQGFSYLDFPETFDWMSTVNDVTMPDVCDTDIVPSLEEDTLMLLEKGSWVVDIGCGTGELIIHLARKFYHSSFIGIDTSADALRKADMKTADAGICNITWQQGDAHTLPEEWINCFDLVLMYGVLHDLPFPAKVLAEIRRILKPIGCLTVVEPALSSKHEDNVGNKSAAACFTFSMFSCLPSSLGHAKEDENETSENNNEETLVRNVNPGIGIDNTKCLLGSHGFLICSTCSMTSDPDSAILVCKLSPESKMADTEIEPHLEQTALNN